MTRMLNIRTILAGLVALAVAVAPVATTLLASAGARAATAAVTAEHDCHGKAQHHEKGPEHHSDKAGCPDCDGGQNQTKTCIGDGVKCCKLIGMVVVLPVAMAPADSVALAAAPLRLTGWQVRPPPPPPRA
jgi:hypothetical protein